MACACKKNKQPAQVKQVVKKTSETHNTTNTPSDEPAKPLIKRIIYKRHI